ncbi:MAG: ABC transporter permease [Firmicutes bacterium]|nr:ABC transporter permease [Bacillota bacterium]
MNRYIRSRLFAPLLILALLMLWEAVGRLAHLPPYIVPVPSQIGRALWEDRVSLWENSLTTLGEMGIGLAFSLIVGWSTAVAMVQWRGLAGALYPLSVVSQMIPTLAIAPVLVLWFGYGIWPKAIVTVLLTFFPLVVTTYDGLRSTDPELIDLYRSFGASNARIFWSVRWPYALPHFFSGLKMAVTWAVVGAAVAEWVGAQAGLGYYIQQRSHQFATAGVFAAVVVLALWGLLFFGFITWIERRAVWWAYARPVEWEPEQPQA